MGLCTGGCSYRWFRCGKTAARLYDCTTDTEVSASQFGASAPRRPSTGVAKYHYWLVARLFGMGWVAEKGGTGQEESGPRG